MFSALIRQCSIQLSTSNILGTHSVEPCNRWQLGFRGRTQELESRHLCSSPRLVLYECVALVTVFLSFGFLVCKIGIMIPAA